MNLAKYRVKNAVRFGWWSAEEFGLVGSEYYVDHLPEEERQKVALYLNFDMIASPNAGIFVFDGDGNATTIPGAPGSAAIETLYRDYFYSHDVVPGAAGFTGNSDYQPFLDIGIPTGGLNTGSGGIKTAEEAARYVQASLSEKPCSHSICRWGGQAGIAYDACYHLACDTVQNLNVDVWERNAKSIAHGIATYANDITGIPRAPRPPVRTLRVAKLSYEQRLHLSCDHDDDSS